MKVYKNKWIFGGYSLEEIPHQKIKYEGFVYLITNKLTGKKYIGKKGFWIRRKKPGMARRKTMESDWKNYYGSSDELKADVKKYGEENFSREILHICKCKKAMSYWEISEQIERKVIFFDYYYNTNISGKYFSSERHLYINENFPPGGLEIG